MISFFKCKHPADSLIIYGEHTTKRVDKDFNQVTYRLKCHDCDERIDISCMMANDIDSFMNRKQG